MSGADCQDGCTSCPTCRGEVQPDSPAMHDMSFAMAMERRAFADPVWGPRAVAQTVREGIRRRGGQSVDDRRMLEFVDGAGRVLGALDADSPWGQPGFSFDGGEPPSRPAKPKPPMSREWHPEDQWMPTYIPEEYLDSVGYGKCCPDPIDFPTEEELAIVDTRERPMPQNKIPGRPLGVKIRVTYSGVFKFNPKPAPPCRCECCEFRQLIVHNILFLTNCAILVTKPQTDSPNAGEHEDCAWVFMLVNSDGTPHVNSKGKLTTWDQPGRKDEPPDPLYTPAIVIGGPQCKGHRHGIPTGVKEPTPRPPLWVPPLDHPPDSGYSGCEYKFTDRPSQVIPATCSFFWDWLVILQVVDICRGSRVRRESLYGFRVRGKIDEEGEVTWTERPSKKPATPR